MLCKKQVKAIGVPTFRAKQYGALTRHNAELTGLFMLKFSKQSLSQAHLQTK